MTLQLFGNCVLYVFSWYVCRLFLMNYGAVSTEHDDPFHFQRTLLFLTHPPKICHLTRSYKPRVMRFKSGLGELR
jgi:hypothetical protein